MLFNVLLFLNALKCFVFVVFLTFFYNLFSFSFKILAISIAIF